MFGTPSLIVWDAARILAAFASMLVIGMTPFALARQGMSWSQRVRFIGSALLGAAIIGAYLQQLGTDPQQWWRTVLVVTGVVLGAVGLAAYLREDRDLPQRRHRR